MSKRALLAISVFSAAMLPAISYAAAPGAAEYAQALAARAMAAPGFRTPSGIAVRSAKALGARLLMTGEMSQGLLARVPKEGGGTVVVLTGELCSSTFEKRKVAAGVSTSYTVRLPSGDVVEARVDRDSCKLPKGWSGNYSGSDVMALVDSVSPTLPARSGNWVFANVAHEWPLTVKQRFLVGGAKVTGVPGQAVMEKQELEDALGPGVMAAMCKDPFSRDWLDGGAVFQNEYFTIDDRLLAVLRVSSSDCR